MSIADQELIDLARLAIVELKDAALGDPVTYATKGGMTELDGLGASLEAAIDAKRGVNPNYACLPEMAAAMIVLATTNPEAYERLVADIEWAPGEPRSLLGMRGLEGLIRLISDDHDFSLADDGPEPRLIPQPREPFRPTVSPKTLLAAIKPLVDGAPSPSARP